MRYFRVFILLILLTGILNAQRIKDIAYFKGVKSEQLIGYGLVVGLAGSGDSYRSTFTVQSVISMLKRFGITVPQENLRTRNIAAVMVTATVSNLLEQGATFDVLVSSLGDATSLMGGTLLMTPLSGKNGEVYAIAQGAVSVGGYDINTTSGGRVARNHALSGRIPNGGELQKGLANSNSYNSNEITILLREPDFTTLNNIANAINTQFNDTLAKPLGGSEIKVKVPDNQKNNITGFLASLESIQVTKDVVARVVLNEKTGTVVSGTNVRISPVTITHGSLNITIKSFPIISQPSGFSQGETVFFNNRVPSVEQQNNSTYSINGATNVQEVAAALNSLKVSPRDIIAIFQALKEAGALNAELIII